MIYKTLSNDKFNIIIYYPSDSDLLKKYILNSLFPKQNIFVRDPSEIFVSLKILFYFFFNLFLNIHLLRTKNLRFFYELTLIKILKPKLVITLIDDDLNFLSFPFFFDNQILFIAVQNGFRADWYVSSNASILNDRICKFPRPSNFMFFCFGEYERELYANYFPNLPLLPSGSFRVAVSNQIYNDKEIYDICLILPIELFIFSKYFRSEWESYFAADQTSITFEIFQNNLSLLFNLEKYCSLYQKKLIIPTLSGLKSREVYFLKSLFNSPLVDIFDFDQRKHGFESYHFINNSKVILGTSTMMTEAFGTGKKVLQAEFTQEKFFTNKFLNDINHLYSPSFSELESKLNNLFSMSDLNYLNLSKDKAKYFYNLGGISTDVSIRSFILDYFKNLS